jgi:hypothetical protein
VWLVVAVMMLMSDKQREHEGQAACWGPPCATRTGRQDERKEEVGSTCFTKKMMAVARSRRQIRPRNLALLPCEE